MLMLINVYILCVLRSKSNTRVKKKSVMFAPTEVTCLKLPKGQPSPLPDRGVIQMNPRELLILQIPEVIFKHFFRIN